MKRVLKWVGAILVSLIAIAIIAGVIAHEKLPQGQSGPEADKLALKMQEAIHMEAWDSTRFIKWNFAGLHSFLWDKKRHLVRVNWGDKEVLLDTRSVEGKAYVEGQEVTGEKAEKLVQKAWSYFCNDSFWLNAPAKAFDPGTKRSIVQTKEDRQGLLVTYSSGGVTPGDSYLWLLDDNGRPEAWKMWVGIIPIGGISSSWENWKELKTGALIATEHDLAGIYTSTITELQGGKSLKDLQLTEDPFSPILRK